MGFILFVLVIGIAYIIVKSMSSTSNKNTWSWKCPSCGQYNDPSYLKCSCGYEANSSEANYLRLKQEQYERDQQQSERNKQQYERNQQLTCERLIGYIADTNNAITDVTKMIQDAEVAINEAINEFADGAFAPFWDAVERAATNIAQFDRGLHQIGYITANYNKESKNLDSTPPPPFNVNLQLIPCPNKTVDRMQVIVRIAQKDFHFATIYEQRKTNRLLVEGFTSLGQTLYDMNSRISTSIDALANSISDLSESNRNSSRQLLSGVEALRGKLDSDAEARRKHEDIELEMLDNIQRRRKPSVFT